MAKFASVMSAVLTVCMLSAVLTACKPYEKTDPNATGADTAISDTPAEPEAETSPNAADSEAPAQSDTVIVDEEAHETSAAPVILTTGGAAAAIKAAYGDDWLSNAEIPASALETRFGLTPDMYDEVTAYEPIASVHNDKIIIVRARDGRLDDVVTALEKARENFIGSLQYPQNSEKNEASKVVFHNEFAAFILAGNVPDDVDGTDERMKIAEQQNKIGVDAFLDYTSAND